MQYYFLSDLKKIGKVEGYVPYLYDSEKGWVVDNEAILMDRIMGYDGESIGSSSVLSVEEITEEQALEMIDKLKG